MVWVVEGRGSVCVGVGGAEGNWCGEWSVGGESEEER